MRRRTKIVVTLGPATDERAVLERCLEQGMNVARLNYSHADATAHAKRVVQLRDLTRESGQHVALMADLQGPKIRIGCFEQGSVMLEQGQTLILDTQHPLDAGTADRVGVDYPALVRDVQPGRRILLDDGRIECEIVDIRGSEVVCLVLVGGRLSDRKGINLRGGGLSADVITSKDKMDLNSALAMGVDYIALSFARSAQDVTHIQSLIAHVGSEAQVIVKIERTEAINELDAIIEAADGVMVARGDLAIEVGDAQVPVLQKHIIDSAKRHQKPVITATQMMESMIEQSTPTRAEVSDVANAVLDGADAVMLSAETAVGKHPDRVVEAIARCCLGAESPLHVFDARQAPLHMERFERVDQAIAGATMYLANRLPIKAIIAMTESGSTARWMSKFRSDIPVVALSPHQQTLRRVQLYANVYPLFFDLSQCCVDDVDQRVLEHIRSLTWLNPGDLVVLTRGQALGTLGLTNSLKVHKIP